MGESCQCWEISNKSDSPQSINGIPSPRAEAEPRAQTRILRRSDSGATFRPLCRYIWGAHRITQGQVDRLTARDAAIVCAAGRRLCRAVTGELSRCVTGGASELPRRVTGRSRGLVRAAPPFVTRLRKQSAEKSGGGATFAGDNGAPQRAGNGAPFYGPP